MVTWWPLHFCREYTGDLTFWLSQLNYTNHSVCVYYTMLHCFDRSCIIVSPPPHCLTAAALCHRRRIVSLPPHCVTSTALCHCCRIVSPLPHCVTASGLCHCRCMVSPLLHCLTAATL